MVNDNDNPGMGHVSGKFCHGKFLRPGMIGLGKVSFRAKKAGLICKVWVKCGFK